MEFVKVDDMTKEELKKEVEWIEQHRDDGRIAVVLMYRLEELEEEITTRED